MGFKSSVAIVQTIRFKRKLSSHRNNPFTPPAMPFNNTSFLMQLQQCREQGSTPTSLRFDQYGSTENMIACFSFATTLPQIHPQPPISALSTSQSGNLTILHKECSQNTDFSNGSPNSNPDGQFFSDPVHQNQHSDDASLARTLKLEVDLETHEGDGMLRHCHRHHQYFMDDNFDTHADSGSGTSIKKKKHERFCSIEFGR